MLYIGWVINRFQFELYWYSFVHTWIANMIIYNVKAADWTDSFSIRLSNNSENLVFYEKVLYLIHQITLAKLVSFKIQIRYRKLKRFFFEGGGMRYTKCYIKCWIYSYTSTGLFNEWIIAKWHEHADLCQLFYLQKLRLQQWITIKIIKPNKI